MPAQRIVTERIPHQTVQPFKSLAHVHWFHPKVDPCCRSNTEHDQNRSSKPISCSSVSASKPRLTSIRRPVFNMTSNSLSGGLPAGSASSTLTSPCRPPAVAAFCSSCPLMYLDSVEIVRSFRLQNSSRLKPLLSYAAASRSASATLR